MLVSMVMKARVVRMVTKARLVSMVMKAKVVRQDVQEALVMRSRNQDDMLPEKYDDIIRSRWLAEVPWMIDMLSQYMTCMVQTIQQFRKVRMSCL